MRPGADEAAGFRLQLGAVNAWRLLKPRCSPALGQLVPRSQKSGTRRQARSPRAPPLQGGPPLPSQPELATTRRDHGPAFSPKSQPLIPLPGSLRGRGAEKNREKGRDYSGNHTQMLTVPVFHLGPWAHCSRYPELQGNPPKFPRIPDQDSPSPRACLSGSYTGSIPSPCP